MRNRNHSTECIISARRTWCCERDDDDVGGHFNSFGRSRRPVGRPSLGELWGVASVWVISGGGADRLVVIQVASGTNSEFRRTASSIESLSLTTVTAGGKPNSIFSTSPATHIRATIRLHVCYHLVACDHLNNNNKNNNIYLPEWQETRKSNCPSKLAPYKGNTN